MFEMTPFDRKNRGGLVSGNPFRGLEDFEKAFWSMNPFSFWNDGALSGFKADVRDEGDKYVVEADLPGFSKEDINVELSDRYLTISAERKSENSDKDQKGSYIRCERTYGSFSRSFDVTGVKQDEITAEYKDGVLTLNMPKKSGNEPGAKRLTIN